MCMIAYRPVKPGKRGSNIPTQVVDTGCQRHPDGFGLGWRENGELFSAKYGPAEKGAFKKHLRELDRASHIEYVAHFRFGTHGPKDTAHAHPFEYTDGVEGKILVFHNGVIDIPTADHESDTEVFVARVLPMLPPQWWDDPAMVWLVKESIGWSKLTLMTPVRTIIIGERSGEWDGGIWYSSNHKGSYGGGYVNTYKRPEGTGYTASATYTVAEDDDRLIRLGLLSDGDVEDRDIIERVVDRPYQWTHMGHTLTALEDIPSPAESEATPVPAMEYQKGIMCDQCLTIGDVYIIDGTTFVDITHVVGAADSLLLPEEVTEAF